MPQLKKRVFGNVRLLKLVPSKLFLELLERYGAAGPETRAALALDEDDPQRLEHLVTLFIDGAETLPLALLDALFRIESLANQRGFDQIYTSAAEIGVVFDEGLAKTPLGLALGVFLDHKRLFEHAYDHVLIEEIKNFRYFRGERPGPTTRPEAEVTDRLGETFATEFKKSGKAKYCVIRTYSVDRDLCFLIERCRAPRVEEAIEAQPDGQTFRHTRVQFVPPARDLVRYEFESGLLEVYAPDNKTARMYVGAFGRLLFEHEDWFKDAPVVTLAPLARDGRKAVVPVRGITFVDLVEIGYRLGTDPEGQIVIKSDDVFQFLEDRPLFSWERAVLTHARLLIRYDSGGKARALTIKPPSVTAYDRRKDDEYTRAFLRQRGFTLPPPQGE